MRRALYRIKKRINKRERRGRKEVKAGEVKEKGKRRGGGGVQR